MSSEEKPIDMREAMKTPYSIAWGTFQNTPRYSSCRSAMEIKGMRQPFIDNILRDAFDYSWNASQLSVERETAIHSVSPNKTKSEIFCSCGSGGFDVEIFFRNGKLLCKTCCNPIPYTGNENKLESTKTKPHDTESYGPTY